MRLVVIGGGTVGAVTAAGFCSLGHEVVCVENRPQRLAQLRRGRFAPHEPGLEELAAAGIARGALRFSGDMAAALRHSNLLFICVGTPEGTGGAADLSQLDSVAADIARALGGGISGGHSPGGVSDGGSYSDDFPLSGGGASDGGDYSGGALGNHPMGGGASDGGGYSGGALGNHPMGGSDVSDGGDYSGGFPAVGGGSSGRYSPGDDGYSGGVLPGDGGALGQSPPGQYIQPSPGEYLLVIKSTAPPGAHRRLAGLLRYPAGCPTAGDVGDTGDRPAASFEVACVPEFLRAGNAVADFFRPDRIVIGVDSPGWGAVLAELYRPFDCPKIWTGPATAELVKYAANAFLALKISYANLLSDLSEAAGADLGPLLDGVGADLRIGRAFLDAGMGYGGSCLPKDLRALTHFAANATAANAANANPAAATNPANANPAAATNPVNDYPAANAGADAAGNPTAARVANANPAVASDAATTDAANAGADAAANPAAALLAAVDGLNQLRPARIVGRAARALGGLAGRRVAVWGLAFKPGAADVRNAPSLAVVRRLLESGAQVGVHDPAAGPEFAAAIGPHPALRCYADMYAAAQGCHALLLLTEWEDYRQVCLSRLRRAMAYPLVVDGRRIFDPEAMAAGGFRYEALGQPPGGF